METSATRNLIERFLKARETNDREALDDMLHADAAWHPPVSTGVGPYEGHDAVLDAIAGGAGSKIFKPETMQRTIHKIVVEGNSAVVFLRNQGEFVRGGFYDNEYAWHYECADGKVKSVQHYSDTYRAMKQMGVVKSKT